jgi:hypothetical protein
MFCKQSFIVYVFCILTLFVYDLGASKINRNNLKIDPYASEFNLLQLRNNSFPLYNAELEKCNKETCLPQYGTCIDDKICECLTEYANYNVSTACSYERKKVSIAILMEILCPIGTAYFYMGYERLGLLKTFILVFLPGLILFHIYFCCSSILDKKNYILQTFFKIMSYTYLALLIFWLIYDLINISSNKMVDSNGVQLVPWLD